MQTNNFIDRVKVYVKAGKGGDGCLSFRREKFIEFGGPNGGCGGKGGDIIFKVEPNLTTLQDLAFNPHIEAKEGSRGGTYNKTGVDGEDKIILVPLGTVIKQNGVVIADLAQIGQCAVVAKGGRGGRGNQSFKSRFNTAPRLAENGQPGEELTLILELKVLADVGLVGFPNAGKSTFLSAVSAARPKIADYPFTTLNPNLGICSHKGKSFIIADIPGLIEGASEGRGLGHQFLKHVERTRVLIHLVDPQGYDKLTPEKSITVIAGELKNFAKDLAKKPRILVINKQDIEGADKVYEKIKKKTKKPVFLISAATGEGINKLLDEVIKILSAAKAEVKKEEKPSAVKHSVEPLFTIKILDEERVKIDGKKIEQWVAMTNFAQPEAVERLRRIFKKIGLEKALLKSGINDGSTILVSGKEFEWSGAVCEETSALPQRIGGYSVRESKHSRLAKRKARRERKQNPAS